MNANMTTTKTAKPRPIKVIEIEYNRGKRIEGHWFRLAPREETGLEPCPGEAHTNPFIDNCMICAPRWGEIMGYKPLTPAAVTSGVAVPVNHTHKRGVFTDENTEAFEAAVKEGRFRKILVEQKIGRRSFSSYYAYVLA